MSRPTFRPTMQGRSDTRPFTRLIDVVAPVLGRRRVMVVLSQVEPGFTRALRAPEPRAALLSGRDAGVRPCGRARHQAGTLSSSAAPIPSSRSTRRYRAVLEAFGCPILPMRYESAELAKISINCCLVASISVANTLAELCEGIGADWSEIVPALKLDRRIGAYRLSRARPRHRRRQSGARPGDGLSARGGAWQRCGHGARPGWPTADIGATGRCAPSARLC